MTRVTIPDRLAIQRASCAEETLDLMRTKLSAVVPEVELVEKAELVFEINRVKREKNAVILGHNYMEPALYHTVPDYVGDSLQLSRISAETNADIIVFCGVKFMAETAKVLSPGKTVLVPSLEAGCSLSEGIKPADARALKERYPGAPVVTYVNTNADVKAESDYCCTSGNAAAVLTYLFEGGHEKVVFVPDEYLAKNTADELGVSYIKASVCGGEEDGKLGAMGRVVIGWNARCEVHELFTVEDLKNMRKQFPDAVILAHPECPPEVIALCDYSGSTKGMVDYLRDVDAPRYILLTECAMGDNMAIEFPEREMVRACSLRCKHMNLITLQDTLDALRKVQHRIELDPELIRRARKSIDRMLQIR